MENFNKKKAEIGARIKEIRKKRRMAQEKSAETLMISETRQMSTIERGTTGVSLSPFIDIRKTLETESDYLLFGVTASNAETVLHKYIAKMTPDQLTAALDLVKVYAKSCGIDEV